MPETTVETNSNTKVDKNLKKGLLYLLIATAVFIGSMLGLDILNQALKQDIDQQADKIQSLENSD